MTDLQLHFSGHSEQITNIVYTNGYIDPWLYDGITYVTAENATVINVDCKEIFPFYNFPFLY